LDSLVGFLGETVSPRISGPVLHNLSTDPKATCLKKPLITQWFDLSEQIAPSSVLDFHRPAFEE
jgi:hypothetical protein